ncbi:NACHT, LRR and PYD domains-containing protein 12 isoform 2-T4 [Liasis olivaceus]
MNDSVRENLYGALNELLHEEFKEFKWRLENINYDGKPNIPRGRLQDADKLQLVDLMIQNYGDDVAWKVCADVLKKGNITHVLRKLKETIQKVAGGVTLQQMPDSTDYRSHVKEIFQTIKDPNSCLGEYEYLNQRYSNPIIAAYHRLEKEIEHEIMASGKKHAEIMNKRALSSTTLEKLFDPDKYMRIPQIVVLLGPAGIGKTMTARKIMFDWASQQLYEEVFNYVFYINCREMNLHTDTEESSIEEIIAKQCPPTHEGKDTIKAILQNPKKLLFIIDGFDELRFSFDQSGDCLCKDPQKKTSMRILLNSLFQKKILPESYLIITTRPTALNKLQCLEGPRYFEILGFAIKERKEYFHNFFKNEDKATQALKFVEQNDTLFTMCVIPLVCWIICTVMKQEMERDEDLQQTPYTLTAVYMLYLSSLLKFHHKESNQDFQRILKGVCSLAAEGMWNQQILFTEEELKKHNLDQEILPLFLNENIFKRDIECIHSFNFIHLSFQEFFAALFYILEEGKQQHFKNADENLQTLLESSLYARLDFTLTVQFLFGFLNEKKRMKDLKKAFRWKISPDIKECLLEWVKSIIKEWKIHSSLGKEIFSCLYETQDHTFIKSALDAMTVLSYGYNSGMELMILTYCVEDCHNLEDLYVDGPINLELNDNLFSAETHERRLVKRSLELFFKTLTSLRKLKLLRFRRGFLKESSCRHVAEVLKKNQRLRELYLSDGGINDVGIKLLCEGLKHPNCLLEKLRLYDEHLTKSCGECLAEVLRKNENLKELALAPCEIDDKGMELLCEGLKHPNCKLEKFWLRRGLLTGSSCRNLAEVLKKKQSLRELYLSDSGIHDEGIQLLCEGLKHPDCKLEKLWLSSVSLSLSHGRHLAEGLKQNQGLTELDLSHNTRDDTAFRYLCEGLKYPGCKLEKLRVFRGFLTTSQCRELANVFRRSETLRELALGYCQIGKQEMVVLCEGLKHPNCKLEKLCFSTWNLREFWCRHFGEILTLSQSLKELDLSPSDMDDGDLKLLCDGLKHPDCKLQTLRLTCCTLTENCCKYLADVLRENQGLKELALSPSDKDDKAFEGLCEGLKHPGCKLEKLQLSRGFMTEYCCTLLAEALRENQGLKELDLFPPGTVYKAVELLCEELKQSDCKLKRLWLNGECINMDRRDDSVIRIFQRTFSTFRRVLFH